MKRDGRPWPIWAPVLAVGCFACSPQHASLITATGAATRPATAIGTAAKAPMGPARSAIRLTGTVLGPASGVIANNASSLLSNNAAGLVANNAGSLIGNPAASLRVAAAPWHTLADPPAFVPVAGATLRLYAPDGTDLTPAGDTDTTDEHGAFSLDAPAGAPAALLIRARYHSEGQAVELVGVAIAGDGAIAIDPAMTLASKKLASLIASGRLTASAWQPDALRQAAAALAPRMSEFAVAAAALLADANAAATFDALIARSPSLATTFADLASHGPNWLLKTAAAPTASGPAASGGPANLPSPVPTPTPPALPFLAGVEPALAPAGATIYLEGGNWGAQPGVIFPAGMSVPATLDGPQRAHVTVPPGAGTGPIALTGTNALPFRTLGFQPAARHFDLAEPQTAVAAQAATLLQPRFGHTCLQVGNFLYVVGGNQGQDAITTVERALVSADGRVGPFSVRSECALQQARSGHACVVVGHYLYAIGGQAAGEALASIERAPIGPDGSLGAFESLADRALASARTDATVVAVGGYLYALGGSTGHTPAPLASIERAPIFADGSIGGFTPVLGNQLASARAGHAAIVSANGLYLLGGDGPSGPLQSIERAPINPDGTLGAFGLQTGQLATARSHFACSLVGNCLMLAGGRNGGALGSVEQATLAGDGSPGAFSLVPGLSLATPRWGMAGTPVGNTWVLAGGTDGSTPMATLEKASLVGNALPGVFTTLAATTTIERDFHRTLASGPFAYLVGGWSNGADTASIERAAVNADGSLGAFGPMPFVALGSPRSLHAMAIIGNWAYALGGATGGEYGTAVATVERAPIASNGSIGTFVPAPNGMLKTPRMWPNVAVVGPYLYVIGGRNGSHLNTVERATIAADGTLSSFTLLPTNGPGAVSLVTCRHFGSTLVSGNHLYAIGGETDGGLYPGNVEAATINPDGTISTFAVVPGVTQVVPRGEYSTVVVGPWLYVLGGWEPATPADPTIEAARIAPDGTIGSFQKLVGQLQSGAPDQGALALGNYLYVFAGESSQQIERAPLQ